MASKTGRKSDTVTPVFVDTIPADLSDLQAGMLYISMKYNTLVHRCPCGCGGLSEVGLHPATRRLIYDGQSVSIEPSIGVRTLPCRSHYWIRKNRIVWASPLREDVDEWFDENRRGLTVAFEGRSDARGPTDRERWWSRVTGKVRKWF